MSLEVIKFGDPIKGAEKGIDEVVLVKLIKITAKAKSLAPEEFGVLRGSIMYRTKDTEGGHSEGPVLGPIGGKVRGIVGSAVLYATYQEFGTRYMPPQPFLRPAIALHGFNKDVKEVEQAMNDAMKASLKQRFKKRFF
jgi:HK97 gp10 family phage protein